MRPTRLRATTTTLLTTALFCLVSTKHRPNIIIILTDDQDVTLGGLTPLTHTKTLIAEEGITFTNAFATTPICCPSRSSILTGLYLHSHGTLNNSLSGGCCGHRWRTKHEHHTFATVLHGFGYKTFYSGKYLNTYGEKPSGGVHHVPPGWDWWIGLVGNSVYYNYTLSVNGTPVRHSDTEVDYLTDVLKTYSLEFLKGRQDDPFLMVVAPPSPHEPFTPAERHKGTFAGRTAPRTPTFNLPVNKTKHWLLTLPPDVLPPETVNKIDEAFRNRWETLLSVDELVQAVILRLREIGTLDNTYIMLTSDHGFHLGQFGLPWDKRQPYETDIKIPLLLRGPGTVKKTTDKPVLNIDIAASILNMAEIPMQRFGDGRSFLQEINSVSDEPPGRTFLVEYHGEGGEDKDNNKCNDDPNVKLCSPDTSCKCFDARNNTYTCVRHVSREERNDIYCEFADEVSFREYYNLRDDPDQVENKAGRVDTRTQKRVLDCCRKMIRLKKAVDGCFEKTQEVGCWQNANKTTNTRSFVAKVKHPSLLSRV